MGDAKDVPAGSGAPGGPGEANKRGDSAVGGAGVLREHGVDGGVRVAHGAGGVCGADGAANPFVRAGFWRTMMCKLHSKYTTDVLMLDWETPEFAPEPSAEQLALAW